MPGPRESEAVSSGNGGIWKTWTEGWRWRSEGMEEERWEGMMRIDLRLCEERRLQSSEQGKRWPCPKKGRTKISVDAPSIS